MKTITPYQTFAFEVQNTLREWLGKTGIPPDTQKERVMTILRFVAATIFFSAMARKAGRSVWDWKRPALPYAEQWLNPIIAKIKGEYYNPKRLLPSPVQMMYGFAEGVDNVLDRGDWRKLRSEMIRWGPGILNIPGGLEWSRIVDGIVGYAEGGIYDKSGRLMFKMEDKEDLYQAMFAGVWSTKSGQEYLKKREKPFLESFDIDDLLDNIKGLSPEERKKKAKERRKKKKEYKLKF